MAGKATLKRSYHLTVDYKTVHFTGQPQKAMAINNSIPAPTLYFYQGEKAIIHVQNKMDVETSIHWHGILLPNFEDGVPYLTSPPIRPGQTHKFEFIIKQAPGTYWYHSHTGLQEQRGLFGAFIIKERKGDTPTERKTQPQELVLLLSDWTDKNPKEILRSLKRGDEWPAIKKKALPSLLDVLMKGAFRAQLDFWKMRMHGADISDVYYPLFLINGKPIQNYENISSGKKVRLRLINASASTYFWLSFGGAKPLLISADGVNVQPVLANKLLQAVAETYDFIIDIPKGKSIEFKATAQDGSGGAVAVIGRGPLLKAPDIPPLDYIEEMKRMSQLHKGHSDSSHKGHSDSSHKGHSDSSHKAHGDSSHKAHGDSSHKAHSDSSHKGHSDSYHKGHRAIHHQNLSSHSAKKEENSLMKDKASPHPPSKSYSHLKSVKKSNFSNKMPVREIKLDLTGNMWRYVWSFNGKNLSESDKIPIKSKEITRLILNNKTMMHHPLHLHGHFFRVLNKNGDHSPWKHTVDVPPMETTVIEFQADVPGDWFFHCHILYHMKAGMSRIFSQGNYRDNRLKDYPLSKVLNGDRQWFSWGELSLLGRIVELEGVFSNFKNRLAIDGAMSYLDYNFRFKGNFEVTSSYERFISDFFRLYGAVDIKNHKKDLLSDWGWETRIGFKYFLPYLVDMELSLGHRMNVLNGFDVLAQGTNIRLGLDYELMIFPRFHFLAEGYTAWKLADLLKQGQSDEVEIEYHLGLEYRLSQYISLMGLYDSHLGYGLGLHLKL